MNKKPIASNIDFADAEFLSTELTTDTISVLLKSWNGKLIKLIFNDPIQFSYSLGDEFSNAYEVTNCPESLKNSLLRKYTIPPHEHPYKLYQLCDIHNFPFMEIIAAEVSATVIEGED